MSDTAETLGQLLSQSWSEYDRLNGCHHVVRPAIPILFFGDSKRYLSSPLKVLTVGLNPSEAEFPNDDRFSRFPAAKNIADDPPQREISWHLAALDSYFRTNPYTRWFGCFEPILTGLGSSFYDGRENSALHTDLCSPVATSPTWAKLSKDQQSHLLPEGVKLWHSLVKALAPNVVLISVARRYLNYIEFRRLGPSRVIWRLERSRPYEVEATRIEIEPTKSSLLVFGRAAQTPFGTISSADKETTGTTIKEQFHAGS